MGVFPKDIKTYKRALKRERERRVESKRRRTHADIVTGGHRIIGSERDRFIKKSKKRERERDVLVKEKFTQLRRERVRRYRL